MLERFSKTEVGRISNKPVRPRVDLEAFPRNNTSIFRNILSQHHAI